MGKRYFNWKLAIVIIIFLLATIVTVFGLRQWQQNRLTYSARQTGLEAYKKHDWERAAINLGRYLAVNPADVPILFNYAHAQLCIRPLKSDNVRNAIATYRRILRIDKNNYEANSKLISLYLQMDIATEAELIAERSLQANENPEIRTMLAMALAKQRKFAQASTELQNVIEQHPHHISAYEVLGKLAEQYPDDTPGTSRHWFNQAVGNNPSSARAYIARGSFNLRNKKLAEALNDFEKAETLDLSDTSDHLCLASEFINMDMFEKAKSHLLAVEADDPDNLSLWQSRAEIALKMMSKEEMFKVAKEGLEQFAAEPLDFLPIAAELYINCGEFDNANDCLEKLKNKNAEPVTVASLEALLAKAKKQDQDVIMLCKKAQKLGDKSQRTRWMLVNTYLQTGDMQTAVSELRNLVFDEPYQFSGHFELAKLLAQTGNWPEAAEQARQAVQIEPDDLDAALLYIKTQFQLIGNNRSDKVALKYQDIESHLTRLEKKTNGDVEVRLLKFQVAMSQGQFDQAENIVADLTKDNGQLMEVELAGIDLLIVQNKLDEAVNNLYRLIERFPQNILPVNYLASLLDEYRPKRECQTMLEDAIKRADNPVMKRQAGLLLAQFYYKYSQDSNSYQLLDSLAQELPFDIPIKRYLLKNSLVKKDADLALKMINDIKSVEGQDGWQWKYEQAKLWFEDLDFKNKYPHIITLLQDNLSSNPADQTSRLLLAAAYEKAGDLQLAIATYRRALDVSPRDIAVIVPAVAVMYKAKEFQEADAILDRLAKANFNHPEISKQRIRSYLRRGDLSSAEAVLEDLITDDPDNTAVSLSLALLRIRQNKFQSAKELLDSLKAQNPELLAVSAATVELYVAQKMNTQALNVCNELVEKLNNAWSYILRGKTYYAIGQYDKARQDLDRAIEITPEDINAWIARSDFNSLTGHQQTAFEDMQKALKLDSENLQILKRNIEFSFYSGQTEKINQGRQLLEKAFALSPDDVELKLYKAQYLLFESMPLANQQAQEILMEITEQHPTNTDAWKMLARIYFKQAQFSKTMDTVLRGLTYSPEDINLLLLKAQAEAAHSPELAIPTLKILYDSQPENIDIVLALAKTYMAMGRNDEAVTLLKDNLATNSNMDKSEIYTELAVALYKSGDTTQAMQQFDLLYKTSPNIANVFLAESNLLIENRQWDMLSQRIDYCLSLKTDKTSPLIAVAERMIMTNDDNGIKIAEKLLRTILDRDAYDLKALSSLAMFLQNTSQAESAAKFYKKILEIVPDNLIAINNLAWIISQEQGDHQRALELAQTGLQKAPDYIDLIDTRGVVYNRLGQNYKAVNDFTKCIEMYPKNSSSLTASHFHLAKTLVELGQNAKAVDNFQKSLDLSKKVGGLSQSQITEAEHLISKLLKKNAYVSTTN